MCLSENKHSPTPQWLPLAPKRACRAPPISARYEGRQPPHQQPHLPFTPCCLSLLGFCPQLHGKTKNGKPREGAGWSTRAREDLWPRQKQGSWQPPCRSQQQPPLPPPQGPPAATPSAGLSPSRWELRELLWSSPGCLLNARDHLHLSDPPSPPPPKDTALLKLGSYFPVLMLFVKEYKRTPPFLKVSHQKNKYCSAGYYQFCPPHSLSAPCGALQDNLKPSCWGKAAPWLPPRPTPPGAPSPSPFSHTGTETE